MVEMGLRDHSFAIRYTTSIGLDKIQAPNKIDIALRYKEDPFNNMLVGMGTLGFQIIGAPRNTTSLDFSLGTKLISAKATLSKTVERTGLGIALGGEVNYYPKYVKQIGIVGDFFYAPPILSFADSNAFTWYGIQLDYYLIENAQIFIGYRRIEMLDNTKGGRFRLDDGSYGGIKLIF